MSCKISLLFFFVFLAFYEHSEAKQYIQTKKKHCYYDKYGNYDTLEEAKLACTADKKCSKVYDDGCDNAGPFYLCPNNSTNRNASLSCIYLKNEKDCPGGYKYLKGDAAGIKWAIRGPSGLLYNPFSEIEDCGKLCNGIDHCKAIEWSPSQRKCVLIKTENTDGPKFLDYYFCAKVTLQSIPNNDWIPIYPTVRPTQTPRALLLDCIRKNSKCIKKQLRGIYGSSCSKMYKQCVARATEIADKGHGKRLTNADILLKTYSDRQPRWKRGIFNHILHAISSFGGIKIICR